MLGPSVRSTPTRRLLVLLASAGCAVAVTATAGTPASADLDSDKAKADRQVQQLRDQLEGTSNDLTEAFLALQATQGKLPGAQQAVAAAQAEVARADAANQAKAAELAVAQANEQRAVAELDDATTEQADAQRRLAGFAAQMYQDQGLGQLSVALDASSPDDFATRIALADQLTDVQSNAIDRLAAVRAGAVATEARIAALREEVAVAKVAAQQALDDASATRDRATAARQALDALAATQTQQAASVKAKQATEKAKLASAEAEQRTIQAKLVQRAAAAKAAAAAAARARGQSGSSGSSGTSSGFLSRPVSGGWISSEFGSRYHPILHYWRLHAGRDYAVNCGTPILAAADGTIVSTGWAGGYGNRIEVDHGVRRGVNLVTAYNHMSGYAVRSGHVSRGQVIGYVGTTGSSTGCHLHFETYEDGVPKDPRRWL